MPKLKSVRKKYRQKKHKAKVSKKALVKSLRNILKEK